jgi:hypothetical protein
MHFFDDKIIKTLAWKFSISIQQALIISNPGKDSLKKSWWGW